MTLVASDIRFGYLPGRTVLHGISAQARAGAVTALIGPNAAGKTTLLRIMAGLLVPQSGTATLDGKPLAAMSAIHRSTHLAYVAQRPTVDAPFTVREVVDLGRFGRARTASAIDGALDECRMTELADTPYHELSAGQQQRAALARAIAQLHGVEPEARAALVLDEPMSAMDPRHSLETASLLRRIAARGIAVIAALHDLAAVSRLADEVWMLRDGRLLGVGPLGETLDPSRLTAVFDVHFDAVGSLAGPDGRARPVFVPRS